MTTFAQMTDDTIMYMQGFTGMQDQATYLTAGINDTVLSLAVADTTSISRGVVEVGSELIWVDSVDSTGLTCTIPPYGRGYRSTTAASHASGTRVVSSPAIPRGLAQKALNEAVQSIFPSVTAVGTTTFTFNPAVSTYEMPTGTEGILAVTWETTGPSREWVPVRRYSSDGTANVTDFPSGSTISLYDAIVPGRTVQVVYLKQPTVMSSESDVFTTVTGLPASCEDVVRLGAAFRMMSFIDAPHLSGFSAEADFSSNVRPAGGAMQLGKHLYQMYRLRLEEEAVKQQSLYPARSHYTR